MNKKQLLTVLGTFVVGGAVGTFCQYQYDKMRINMFRPLMINALTGLLVDVHTNPDITAEEIREKTAVELEFLKIAIKN